MHYQVFTGRETILQSCDDCFTDMKEFEKGGETEGYIWGTNWANACPGFSIVENSSKAQDWNLKLNKPIQEIQVDAEIMKMNLVFHDWTLKNLNSET